MIILKMSFILFIKVFSYSMSRYIKIEHPQWGANESIKNENREIEHNPIIDNFVAIDIRKNDKEWSKQITLRLY